MTMKLVEIISGRVLRSLKQFPGDWSNVSKGLPPDSLNWRRFEGCLPNSSCHWPSKSDQIITVI